jgi:hypothetical protein
MKLPDLLTDVGRPVAYYPKIAEVAGGATSAIFLCQFIYWEGKQKDPDGWIYKTQANIKEETGLTRYEQETVRKKLKAKGLLEEKYQGIPRKLYYRINLDALNDVWEAYRKGDQVTETPKSQRMGKSNIIARGDLVGNKAGSQQAIYTEITDQRILTENTEEAISSDLEVAAVRGASINHEKLYETVYASLFSDPVSSPEQSSTEI